MPNVWRAVLSWAMVLFFPASLFAAETGGAMVLRATGEVVVNGISVPGSIAIMPGEKLTTSANSNADVVARGSLLTVGANSSLKYEGISQVELEYGVLKVTTGVAPSIKSLTVRVSNLLVAPTSSGRAQFEVTRTQGKISVAAKVGTIEISDGKASSIVQPGTTAVRDDPQNTPAPQGASVPLSPHAAYALSASAAVAAAVVAIVTTKLHELPVPASPVRP
jgi:hypothetical protein